MTPMWDVICRASELARPYAKWLIVGGPHPTAVKHGIFDDNPYLDAGVVGEGEDIVVKLLQWFETGGGAIPEGVLILINRLLRLHLPKITGLNGKQGIC